MGGHDFYPGDFEDPLRVPNNEESKSKSSFKQDFMKRDTLVLDDSQFYQDNDNYDDRDSPKKNALFSVQHKMQPWIKPSMGRRESFLKLSPVAAMT